MGRASVVLARRTYALSVVCERDHAMGVVDGLVPTQALPLPAYVPPKASMRGRQTHHGCADPAFAVTSE